MASLLKSHNGVHCCGTVGDSHSHSQLSTATCTSQGGLLCFRSALQRYNIPLNPPNKSKKKIAPRHACLRADSFFSTRLRTMLIRYAAILLDYADETGEEFDELLLEKNRFGAFWLHFAVKPKENRHKVAFIRA